MPAPTDRGRREANKGAVGSTTLGERGLEGRKRVTGAAPPGHAPPPMPTAAGEPPCSSEAQPNTGRHLGGRTTKCVHGTRSTGCVHGGRSTRCVHRRPTRVDEPATHPLRRARIFPNHVPRISDLPTAPAKDPPESRPANQRPTHCDARGSSRIRSREPAITTRRPRPARSVGEPAPTLKLATVSRPRGQPSDSTSGHHTSFGGRSVTERSEVARGQAFRGRRATSRPRCPVTRAAHSFRAQRGARAQAGRGGAAMPFDESRATGSRRPDMRGPIPSGW
jgi:hypothetical protein